MVQLLAVTISLLIRSLIVMWLWNMLSPTLGLPTLDYWQALTLTAIIGIAASN